MREFLKKITEETFERVIKENLESNPMKGTFLEGLSILEVITKTVVSSRKGLIENTGVLEFMNEIEINQMVDEISKKMREKYLRM